MIQKQDTRETSDYRSNLEGDSGRKLKFGTNDGFHAELRRRVDEYFQRTGRPQRDCPQMYLKTAILMSCCTAFYVLLVFFAKTWWQALPLAILLGAVTAAIGFNIQHDGRHQAYSDHPWINQLMSLSMDLIGGSSYVWHWKHDVFHHTYANITSHDADLNIGIFGRLTPHQRQRSFHRWQHFYLWLLYGLMAIKWQLYDDFENVITGRIGEQRFPRPKGKALLAFLGGKAVFFTLAFIIPVLFHPVWVVLLFYGVAVFVLGIVLSIVFQLAHCVEEAAFPMPQANTGNIETPWAIHQVQTTVDFARRNPVLTWLLGGLNYQVEHHLFPRICHVNYPAISKVVEETCQEFGVKYLEHKSFGAGIASHFRWLRRMGMSNLTA